MDGTTTTTPPTTTTTTTAPPPPPPIIHRYHGGTSFGPLIVALAVITVLGALAVIMGRVCFGRRTVFGYGRYDLEAWVETKCASCVDGRMDVVIPRPRHVAQPQTQPQPQSPPVVTSVPSSQPPLTEVESESANGDGVEKEPEQPPGTHSES